MLAPRVVGVEFPFRHPFGMPHDRPMQRRVLETALTHPTKSAPLHRDFAGTPGTVLSGASRQGTRVDVDVEWPVPLRVAYRAWQPEEPSPIVALMLQGRRGGEPASSA